MVYDTQSYWVSGLCLSSGILNARNTAFWKLGPNRAGVSLPSPEDGNRSSF
jgi:hypothetical protein